MVTTCLAIGIASFMAGAYAGILAYRYQLKRANERGQIEIYVKRPVSDSDTTTKVRK